MNQHPKATKQITFTVELNDGTKIKYVMNQITRCIVEREAVDVVPDRYVDYINVAYTGKETWTLVGNVRRISKGAKG